MGGLKPFKNLLKKELYFSFFTFLKNIWDILKKDEEK